MLAAVAIIDRDVAGMAGDKIESQPSSTIIANLQS
jgi:hypothetical protein